MTLLTVNPQDVFTVRTIKRFNEQRWANSFELMYTGSATMADPVQVFNDVLYAIADAEADLLLNRFTLERAVLGTIERDSRPYDPETFISLAIEIAGRRTVPFPQTVLPLHTCVLVKKAVQTGRQGNLLLRGLLHTGNGSMDIDGFTLDPPTVSLIENRLNNLAQFLEAQFSLRLCLIGFRPNGTFTPARMVRNLEVRARATIKALNNKYFDKGNGNDSGGSTA